MTDNPWKTLSVRTVYDNPWIRVEHHDVVKPSGGPGQYGKVCFKNVAVAIAALDGAGGIVLVGQYRYTLDQYSWELPLGGAPLGESPRAAAERELREETGITARQWRELMLLHPSNSVTDEVGYVYVAEELEQGEPDREDTEELVVRTVPFEEAVRFALDGRITDAMSVAAILRLAYDAAGSTRR